MQTVNVKKGQLSRSFFSSHVLTHLRRAIVSGELPAGEKLVETAIAEQMGVSRGPVRNALFILENEGLIRFLPNGRTVSNGFSLSDVEMLYEMRGLLELKSIEFLFRSHARPYEPMKLINDELRQNRADMEKFTQLDISYHEELVRLSGNKYLLQSWLSLSPLIETVLSITNERYTEKGVAAWEAVIDHHERLMAAIVAGNLSDALLLLKDHLEIGKQTIIAQFEQDFQRQG